MDTFTHEGELYQFLQGDEPPEPLNWLILVICISILLMVVAAVVFS